MVKEDLRKISKSKKSSKKGDDSRERSKSRERSVSKSREYFEKHAKIEKSKKKDDAKTEKKKSTSEKGGKTFNDKIEKEIKDKKHKLDEITYENPYENPEKEPIYSSESSSSENSSSESSGAEDNDDNDDVDMINNDEFEETQPLFEIPAKKRKVLSESEDKIKKNEIKKLKLKKRMIDLSSKLEELLMDWDKKCSNSTSDIDYKAFQLTHSPRDVYFIAPDGYVYPNQSTMKKVSDAVKKKEIDEKTIASLVQPIKRVVAVNPRITFGITGLRYIGSGGGFGVQTIFYVAKEYMTEKDQTSGCLKLVKVQIPISALENFGRAVNSAIEIINEVNPKKEGDNDNE